MCRAAACRGGAGGRDGGAWRGSCDCCGAGCWYCGCGGAGRSHWMPASLQSWWDRCHGEGAAAFGVPAGGRPARGWPRPGWPRPGWPRPGWPRPGWRRPGWLAERNGWAGIRGHPPGRAAPGSRLAHGASASASAVRTRIRPARGGARAPHWPRAKGWREAEGWHRAGRWQGRGWRPTVAVRAGTIPREAPRRARNCRQRLARRRLAHRRLARSGAGSGASAACPGGAGSGARRLARAGQAPGNRRPAAGAGPESSGLAARTRGEPGFPDHPSGTGLYAAAPPLARNHVDDSHSTGHFLYSSQTPVQAHFWQNAIACRSHTFSSIRDDPRFDVTD